LTVPGSLGKLTAAMMERDPMRIWAALLLASLAVTLTPSLVVAQPEVERLKAEVAELKRLLAQQRKDFEAQIGKLERRVDEDLAESIRSQLSDQVEEIVADKSKFYMRPRGGRGDADITPSVFRALEGGLIFSGLFRSRFEYRAHNVDLNASNSGLDDEGTRFNGRFRLGFGAVMLNPSNETDLKVTALTEFQAVGTFSNNTYFSFAGPGGVPLPTEFTIFKEPFEQVGIYQGYMAFDRILAPELYMRVGRQEVIMPQAEGNSSEFIFGNNSFYDGTVHDGLLVTWSQSSFSLSGFYFKEAQSDSELAVTVPGDDFDEDWLAGLYSSWSPDGTNSTTVDAYALFFDGRSNFTDSFVTRTTASAFDGALTPAILGHFWTLGARVFWSQIDALGGLLQFNAEAAFQTGNNGVDPLASGGLDEQDIRGWATELLVNWWVDPDNEEGWQPIVSLSYYYAEGGEENDNTGNGFPNSRIGFQPLFINRHFDRPAIERGDYDQPYFAGGGRYGNMDLIPLTNIHAIKAAVTVAPQENLEIGLAGVMAITADDEGWGTGVFGYELDLFAVYDYNEWIRFSSNFSVFFPGKTADDMVDYYFFSPSGVDGEAGDDLAFAFYLQALIAF